VCGEVPCAAALESGDDREGERCRLSAHMVGWRREKLRFGKGSKRLGAIGTQPPVAPCWEKKRVRVEEKCSKTDQKNEAVVGGARAEKVE